jgi:hypothetical protein
MLITGCEKEVNPISFTSDDINTVVSTFELKYGDSKEITYKGETIHLSIKNIRDNVSVNCSLVDFSNNQKGPEEVRIYADLLVNNKTVSVASKPCGALNFEANGHDIQQVNDLIDNLKSAPANSTVGSYFADAFMNYFGEGALIENTSFRIFMAKAYPVNYEQPDAKKEDYKFIFLITR